MLEYLLPLADRREVADGTMSFWLDTTGTKFTFAAGQYASFTLPNFAEQNSGGQVPEADEWSSKHDFSIASAPYELPRVMLTTRMRDTAFKRTLKTMPLGTKVKVSAPMGSFTLHKNAERPALFIAGGIGVTPIRSIVADTTNRKLPHKMMLLYSNRTVASTAFLADFEQWAKYNPNFIFLPTITDEQPQNWTYEVGYITEPMLRTHLVRLASRVTGNASPIAYIVGPPAFVSAMLPIVEKAGIDPDNIRTEEFAGY
jgi:ferredoxin-NADP reductase